MDLVVKDENQASTCHRKQSDIFSSDNISECERYVLTIQRRLDKAVANDDKPKIRWNLHLLSKRSRAVKILSVHRVCTTNQGKYTTGVDGYAMPKDRNKRNLEKLSLLENIDINQEPDPIRRVFIPKPNGSKRPLGIPTIKDRIIQDIIRQSIEPICEYHFKTCSYGFRPKRSCQDAMSDLFNKLVKPKARKWVIEGDIKGCFDNIDHNHIINMMSKWKITNPIRQIIKGMLKADIMSGYDSTPSYQGTPQGGIISPMLANIALTCLDEEVDKVCGYTGRKMSWLVRYADDFVIVVETEQQAKDIRKHIKAFLINKVGVELSDNKTLISEISNGFDFLGFNFRKYQNKLLIKPSKDSVMNVRRNLAKKSNELTNSSAHSLIGNINPIIRGWGNYYRHCVAKQTFNAIDSYIWLKAWQWTKKKHPNSTAKYRRDRYIKTIGNRRWVFHDRETETHLTKMNQIPIKRFIKIQKDIRVYDVNTIAYWEKRMYLNAKNSIIGSVTLTKLFRQQQGRCDYCNRHITSNHIQDGQLHRHHIKPRSLGGGWKLSNLTLLHSECHTELHGIYNRQEMADLADKGINYVRLMKPKS